MLITLRRGNCNFNRVLQDKWGSTNMARGVRNCGYGHGYGHATGTDMGVRAGIDVNVFMGCTVYRVTHTEHMHECCIQPPSIITSLC